MQSARALQYLRRMRMAITSRAAISRLPANEKDCAGVAFGSHVADVESAVAVVVTSAMS